MSARKAGMWRGQFVPLWDRRAGATVPHETVCRHVRRPRSWHPPCVALYALLRGVSSLNLAAPRARPFTPDPLAGFEVAVTMICPTCRYNDPPGFIQNGAALEPCPDCAAQWWRIAAMGCRPTSWPWAARRRELPSFFGSCAKCKRECGPIHTCRQCAWLHYPQAHRLAPEEVSMPLIMPNIGAFLLIAVALGALVQVLFGATSFF